MKSAAVFVIVSFALVLESFAVLRPRFPIKPEPPFRGDVIVIGDEILQNSPKEAPPTAPR